MRRVDWSWISRLGLWPRVALAITVGFLVLFLAFALLAEQALRESTTRLSDERLVIGQMAAAQIDSLLELAIASLEETAGHVGLVLGEADQRLLNDILMAEGDPLLFSPGLLLLDADGRAISSLPSSLYPVDSDLAHLPHIAQALEGGQATISTPLQIPSNGQFVIAITVPIYHQGRLLGLLSGFVDLEGENILAPLYLASGLGKSEHAVLTDSRGMVIVSTFSLEPLTPGEHASFYRQVMASGQPVVDTVPFELDLPGEPQGHLHVMAVVPLENAPWALAVGGDRTVIFDSVYRLRSGLAWFGIVTLVAVSLFTLAGTRLLVRPIRQLTQAADEIAAGNLNAQLRASGGGEIGVMAAALERMRNQLLVDINELAEWNDTLEQRVAEQTDSLTKQQALTEQLLRKVIDAQEGERIRLARDLHDEIGQTLTAVELSLGHLANVLPPENEEARRRLEQSRDLTERTVADLRAIIAALRPGTLDQLGLAAALTWMGDQTLRPSGIAVTLKTKGLNGRVPGEIETTLFRIAQEAMSNVARHSRASALTISLQEEPGKIIMTLSDNGQGFPSQNLAAAQERGDSLGIAGMQERAMLAGGTLDIESRPNEGTTIRVTLPILAQDEEGEHDDQPTD